MKKLVLGVVLCLTGAAIAPAALAQVPVTDVAQITVHQTNQLQTIAKWVESINQYKMQIEQMKQQYESLTGARGLGDVFNDPKFKQYLPAEWQDVYDRVAKGGYKGLTGSAKAIADANGLFTSCTNKTGDSKALCERSAAKGAQDKAFAMEAFDKASQRLDQIAQLMGQINGTTDPKAIAELQARINGEQAAIQNEQTKLQMYQMIAAAEDRIIERQQRESAAQHYGKSKFASPRAF